jgi:short subunit dehydrogenase-like uncharacterized protein
MAAIATRADVAAPESQGDHSMSDLLIYGAYGYSGRLIAAAARRRGLAPILAGRDARQVAAMGRELGLPHRAFALDDPQATARELQGIEVVLHCAGPFSATSKPMLDACIAQRAHYLDITGEFGVMESAAARDSELRQAGIMAMCGAGMDVVPSDCLAAHMKRRLPAATSLNLFIRALERPSRGTARTFIEGMGLPNRVRKGGKLVERPAGDDRVTVDFNGTSVRMVGLPWGDIATAWHTTGIPDIAVYMCLPPGSAAMIRLSGHFPGLCQSAPAQRSLKRLVDRVVAGPGEEFMQSHRAEFIAEARDANGQRCRTFLSTIEGYAFTAESASEIGRRVLAGTFTPGYQTPGRVFGADFVLEFPDSQRVDLE